MKNPLPNIFQGASFKKHAKMLIEDKSTTVSVSIFFLPSTMDRKEKISKFFGNVHLHPIDCYYEDFSSYSVKSHAFYTQHFDSRFPDERQLFHGKK